MKNTATILLGFFGFATISKGTAIFFLVCSITVVLLNYGVKHYLNKIK